MVEPYLVPRVLIRPVSMGVIECRIRVSLGVIDRVQVVQHPEFLNRFAECGLVQHCSLYRILNELRARKSGWLRCAALVKHISQGVAQVQRRKEVHNLVVVVVRHFQLR